MDVKELKSSAVYHPRGRIFEEFEVGEKVTHHWGRTITESDAISILAPDAELQSALLQRGVCQGAWSPGPGCEPSSGVQHCSWSVR